MLSYLFYLWFDIPKIDLCKKSIDSGEMRFKISIDVTGDRITLDLIKRLIYANGIALF